MRYVLSSIIAFFLIGGAAAWLLANSGLYLAQQEALMWKKLQCYDRDGKWEQYSDVEGVCLRREGK